MSAPLRALTIWPEWAWAIAHLDKRVENRGWVAPRWLREAALAPEGAYLAIHAGVSFGGGSTVFRAEHALPVVAMAQRAGWTVGRAGGRWHFERAGHAGAVLSLDAPPVTRAVVAVGRFVGVDDATVSPWYVGAPQHAWVLADVVSLPEPVSCRGALGAWSPSQPALVELRAQYRLARERGAA